MAIEIVWYWSGNRHTLWGIRVHRHPKGTCQYMTELPFKAMRNDLGCSLSGLRTLRPLWSQTHTRWSQILKQNIKMSQQKHSITLNWGRCFHPETTKKKGRDIWLQNLDKIQKNSPAAHNKRPINKCKEVKTKAKHNTGTTLAGQDAQKT